MLLYFKQFKVQAKPEINKSVSKDIPFVQILAEKKRCIYIKTIFNYF